MEHRTGMRGFLFKHNGNMRVPITSPLLKVRWKGEVSSHESSKNEMTPMKKPNANLEGLLLRISYE